VAAWRAGATSVITANGMRISVGNGGGDVGANADTGGQVRLTGGNVSVQGLGGGETGLRATGAGSTITANNLVVNVTGSGGKGASMFPVLRMHGLAQEAQSCASAEITLLICELPHVGMDTDMRALLALWSRLA
jgi:hypothetical protein